MYMGCSLGQVLSECYCTPPPSVSSLHVCWLVVFRTKGRDLKQNRTDKTAVLLYVVNGRVSHLPNHASCLHSSLDIRQRISHNPLGMGAVGRLLPGTCTRDLIGTMLLLCGCVCAYCIYEKHAQQERGVGTKEESILYQVYSTPDQLHSQQQGTPLINHANHKAQRATGTYHTYTSNLDCFADSL